MHKSLGEFLGCLFSAVFHPILFILADNDDMHDNSVHICFLVSFVLCFY